MNRKTSQLLNFVQILLSKICGTTQIRVRKFLFVFTWGMGGVSFRVKLFLPLIHLTSDFQKSEG